MTRRVPESLQQAALDCSARGWAVFPLVPGSRVPAKDSAGHHDATTNPETIRQWWTASPRSNIGVALAPSGLVVLDADRHGGPDGLATLAALVVRHGRLPDGPAATTPRDGVHRYFTRPPDMEARRSTGVRPALDVLADGYVVLPPSIVNGRPYRWLAGSSDSICPPALPGWVVDLVRRRQEQRAGKGHRTTTLPCVRTGRYPMSALAREAQDLAHCPPGQRNAMLCRASFKLATLAAGSQAAGVPCFSEDEAWAVMATACRANGLAQDRSSDGMRGCRRTFLSGWRYGMMCPRALALRSAGGAL